MGVIKGLKQINQRVSEDNQQGSGVRFVKLKDGENVRIRFLQELDPDSPAYNDAAGVGFLAIEHANPKDYKRRALCSADEGECWACDRHNENYKAGWRQKARLYVNVLVMREGQDAEVAVLSQGNGPKSITPWLLDYAGEQGSITSQVFKIKRTGGGQTDTSYTLTPGKFDSEKYDVTQHELFDLDNVVKEVPYEEQEKFYLGTSADAASVTEEDTDTSTEW